MECFGKHRTVLIAMISFCNVKHFAGQTWWANVRLRFQLQLAIATSSKMKHLAELCYFLRRWCWPSNSLGSQLICFPLCLNNYWLVWRMGFGLWHSNGVARWRSDFTSTQHIYSDNRNTTLYRAISHTCDFVISADGQSCMWMLHVEQIENSQPILSSTCQHHQTQFWGKF